MNDLLSLSWPFSSRICWANLKPYNRMEFSSNVNLAPVVGRNLRLKWGGNHEGDKNKTQEGVNAKMEGYLLRYVTLSIIE